MQQVLAPQLRQSLEMLQLPMLELQTIIQKELEQNPALEDASDEIPVSSTTDVKPATDIVLTKEQEFEKEYESLTKLDDEWKDNFFQSLQSTSHSSDDEEKRQFMLDSMPQKESLQEHLMAQLEMSGLNETDMQIGEMIIGSIDDDGYLNTPLLELAQSAQFDVNRMEDVLVLIQDFHPVGVGARDLKECLIIQLEKLGKADSLPVKIAGAYLDLLASKKYQEIARALGSTVEEIQQAHKIISSLDPKPGRLLSSDLSPYVTPEVVVQKIEDKYVVVVNSDYIPHLRISNHYRNLLIEKDTPPEVNNYIREKIKNGSFLIKSIQHRQSTIQKIAEEIIQEQTDFLDNGVRHLRPMTMAEIASRVNVHETTVSRAVSGKFMKTPSGVFDMKYFFTPGIKTESGEMMSNKTIKDMIQQMIIAEDASHPLSDQDIMDQLKTKGINIARRTVAKYRIILKIQPSHLRKTI